MRDINVAGCCRGPADPRKSRRKMMRTLGYVTTIALAAAAVALGLVAVKALPEVRRYLAIRKM
jgi:hypothetical protein